MAAKEDKPNSKPVNPEIQELSELYEMMLDKGLDSVDIKDEDGRIKLVRHSAPPVGWHPPNPPASGRTAPAPQKPAGSASEPAAAAEIPPGSITSPLAGVFYRASSPTSPPYVKEGDVVEPGTTLCIVEAMKVMNEIKAETRCRVTKILAQNGRPVTAGQALFATEAEPA